VIPWRVASRKLRPFFVAERWNQRPGTTVSLAEALQTCRDILDGRYDNLPADAFYFSGDKAEIRGNVRRTLKFGPAYVAAAGTVKVRSI
jgi:F0F1-type ATP synthase beta subunit